MGTTSNLHSPVVVEVAFEVAVASDDIAVLVLGSTLVKKGGRVPSLSGESDTTDSWD